MKSAFQISFPGDAHREYLNLQPYLEISSIVFIFVTFCTFFQGNKGETSEVGGTGCS